MKIFSTFLLLLLLFLTGQPPCTAVETAGSSCCAKDVCTDEEGSPAEENSNDGDCNGCNPFQACSCCAAAAILPAILPVSFSAGASPAVPVWGGYAPDHLRSWSGDFWQPPRLGQAFGLVVTKPRISMGIARLLSVLALELTLVLRGYG